MTHFQRTAAHEAGHAVVAHVLGGHLGLVWALPEYSLHGACGEASVSHPAPDKDATICFAGTVAEAFCSGTDYQFYEGEWCLKWSAKTTRRGLKPNRAGLVRLNTHEPETEAELAAEIRGGRTHDLMSAWRVLRRASGSDREAVGRFDKAQDRAMTLVAENLATVKALASVLETERVLTAERVRGFLGKRF